jgi:hypothetical protein
MVKKCVAIVVGVSQSARFFTRQFFFSADFLFVATLLRPVSNAQQDDFLMAYFGLFPFSFFQHYWLAIEVDSLIFPSCRHGGKARCDIRHVSPTSEPS